MPVKTAPPPQIAAAPARSRRQLVPPPAAVAGSVVPLLPAPPSIAAYTPAATAALIPGLAAPSLPNRGEQGAQAGTIIWTGQLARNGTIQILGNRVSQGRITGGLPGAPVRVQVFPAQLIGEGLRIFTADLGSVGPTEAPGVQNGWNRTDYVLNPRRAGEVSILEAPGQQNNWNRLVLRVERGEHAIIVLRWERASRQSLYAAGNQ
jgi:hypothetical protein